MNHPGSGFCVAQPRQRRVLPFAQRCCGEHAAAAASSPACASLRHRTCRGVSVLAQSTRSSSRFLVCCGRAAASLRHPPPPRGCAGRGLARRHIQRLELQVPKSLLPRRLQGAGSCVCAEGAGGAGGPVPARDTSAQFGFDTTHVQSRRQGGCSCCARGPAVLPRPLRSCGLDPGVEASNHCWASWLC